MKAPLFKVGEDVWWPAGERTVRITKCQKFEMIGIRWWEYDVTWWDTMTGQWDAGSVSEWSLERR